MQGFWEKGSFSSQVFQVKSGRKIGNFHLKSCSKIIEDTRIIEDPVQFSGGKQTSKIINKTNIRECILQFLLKIAFFSLYNYPHFYQKYFGNKLVLL